MFIRVKSKATGHEFDIHENQFDDAKHSRMNRYPPSKTHRRTKFKARTSRAVNVSQGKPVEEGVKNVDDDS